MKYLLSATLIAATPAFAQATIPIVDVEANCTRAGNGQSYARQCIALEQQAYDQLKFIWPRLSSEDRSEFQRLISNRPTISPTSPGYYRSILGFAEFIADQRRAKEEQAAPLPRFRP